MTILSDVASQLREQDYAGFLAALFVPSHARETIFTVLAFNHELRTIPNRVTEPMMAHIRFTWWREALEEIVHAKTPRKHPLVEALAVVVGERKISASDFMQMVNAHEQAYAQPDVAKPHTLQLKLDELLTPSELQRFMRKYTVLLSYQAKSASRLKIVWKAIAA